MDNKRKLLTLNIMLFGILNCKKDHVHEVNENINFKPYLGVNYNNLESSNKISKKFKKIICENNAYVIPKRVSMPEIFNGVFDGKVRNILQVHTPLGILRLNVDAPDGTTKRFALFNQDDHFVSAHHSITELTCAMSEEERARFASSLMKAIGIVLLNFQFADDITDSTLDGDDLHFYVQINKFEFKRGKINTRFLTEGMIWTTETVVNE